MSVLMVIAYVIIGAAAWGVLIFGIMALHWSCQIRRNEGPQYRTRRPDWSAAPPPYPPRGTDQQPPTSGE